MSGNSTFLPGEYVVSYGHENITLYRGWISSPNQRGTIDIIWSCVFTIFLSSWSILCLNVPASNDGFWIRVRRKTLWTLLTVMGPEVIFQLALGEWLHARKSCKDFRASGHEGWTMTHSYYCNMGGVMLHTRDAGKFPVNAAQLHYLLQEGYITYPHIDPKTIQDKNKAEPVVRAITLVQTLWFLIQCIGRACQHLGLTALELSTLAFISSAIGTFFCWYHKPMDVDTPMTIELEEPIASIQAKAGRLEESWAQTPLDFVDRRREWPWNIYWRWGLALLSNTKGMSGLIVRSEEKPIERIPNDYWPEPTFKSLPVLFFFHFAYVGILMAGWNLKLPTYTELVLWRVAASIQLGTIISAWFTMPMQLHDSPAGLQRVFSFVERKHRKFLHRTRSADAVERKRRWYEKFRMTRYFSQKMDGARTLISDDPEWAVSIRLLIVYEITWVVYLLARGYVIAEDFASLRALPPSTFRMVDWSLWFPHLS